MPIAWYVGNNPINTVAIPIIDNVKTSVRFLPILSPIYPKMIPPNGRMKNASARDASSQQPYRRIVGYKNT